MAKLKSALLGFDARGTLGDAITFQKRNQDTIVREKPIPAYRRTLPQVYQRWLYEDYAYLWTQQTASTRQEYTSAGSRWHLTGFQYWMKYHLTNLPDRAGMWHLDEKAGAFARDFSKNANHGTIIGATPTDGVIDGAYYFDGLNDTIQVPTSPSIRLQAPFTLEIAIKPDVWQANDTILAIGTFAGPVFTGYILITTAGGMDFGVGYGTGYKALHTVYTSLDWTLFHALWDGTILYLYANGVYLNERNIGTQTIVYDAYPLVLGRLAYLETYWFPGIEDNPVFYTRLLDQTEMLNHTARRYP